jgi:hypothetical protein
VFSSEFTVISEAITSEKEMHSPYPQLLSKLLGKMRVVYSIV